jgi:glycerate kinase
VKVVVAPNAFKGSLTATQAAHAIALGVRDVFPKADVVEVPVADGGDGTVEALVSALHGEYRTAGVEGPLGDVVKATYGLTDHARMGIVELASASGLTLIPTERRDPRRASTYGFGQLLEAVRTSGASKVIAGLGGSATNDGGAGMAQALGYRLLDAAGRDIPRGGAALARLVSIDAAGFDRGWEAVSVDVACDVTNPLTGPTGASAVYGPQKGADEAAVRELDAALSRLAAVIERDLGKKVADLPGAGAAGGAGAGLLAFLDARLVPGAPLVVSASGFDQKLEGADLVITGEGRVDVQSAYGKAPGEVAKRGKAAKIPVLLIAGSKAPGWEALSDLGVTAVVTLDEEGDNLQKLMGDAGEMLRRATARACRDRAWE